METDDDNDDKKQQQQENEQEKQQQQQQQEKEERIRQLQTEARDKQKRRTKDFGNLMRSKGFVWQATSHDVIGYMSQAGSTLTLSSPGTWKVLDKRAYTGYYKERMTFRKGFVDPYGDRRQEMVFIGQDLHHSQIQKVLDTCLLTNDEFKLGVDGWKATMGDLFLGSPNDKE